VAFGTKEPTTATEKLVVLAETRLTDASLRAQLNAQINECVVKCIGEPPDEVVLAAPHTVLKTSSGKLRRAATRAAYEDHSLGHAPGRPVVQMLRLMIEDVMSRLRRACAAGAHAAYGWYVWSMLFAIGIPACLRIALCSEPARAWRLTHRAASRLVRAWSIPFSVKGEAAIDLPVPHIIVANHCSYMDSIFAAALLPQPHIMVAKAELERIPLVRAVLRALGTIFVERSDRGEHLGELEQIKQTLAQGTSIFIFPEGTFTPVTGLRPFQLGAFEIAVASDSPVIPVSLNGTRLVLRDGRCLPRRLPVTAVVGAPLVKPSCEGAFAAAVQLRDTARAHILRHCGEPDLI
jgi:1-acyl-sn-glycerol-3-phosphate acyltransferase